MKTDSASKPISKKPSIGFSLILGAFVLLAWYAYFSLPETVAVHWNAQGEADGYGSKGFGIILFPAIALVLYGIFRIVPRIDPRRKNILEFQSTYEQFIMVMEGFFLYVFMLFVAWNSGIAFSFVTGLIPAFAVLMYYLGNLLEHAKQNYFIGIRTPWTLANEKVWNETHARTGRLLKIMALLPLIGLVSEQGEIGWMLVPMVATLLYGAGLSYFLHRKYVQKK